MRIAIFSDVHGNRFALEAVLRDIETFRPDAIANLGDQVWGGADPAGAWKLQQEVGATTVRGNTDEFIIWPEKHEGAKAYAEWLRSLLPNNVGQQLEALPINAELAEGQVLVAHGSITSPWDALMVKYEGQPREVTPDEMLEQVAGFPRAKVVVVGHTHDQKLRSKNGITFVNAGPVSRQFDGDPTARWVLLEKRQHWSISFQRVSYDTGAAASWALSHAPNGEQEALMLRTAQRPR
jgi:putative phosphoesterase